MGVRVSRLGKSSFTMEYEIRDAAGELLVSAQTEQVMYDYEAGRSKAIPDDLRNQIMEFEGEAQAQGEQTGSGRV